MHALAGLATRVRLRGTNRKRRQAFGFAFLLGALTVLALPPVYILPILIPTFVGTIWLLEDTTPGRAALIGWAHGLGFFVAGTYWIGEAFLVDPGRTGWLAPFAVLGLAAGLALFPCLGFAVSVWIWRRFSFKPAGRILIFAIAWTVMEWLRGHILTGFPWNLISTVWAGDFWMTVFPVAQIAALTGAYGLSLLTIIAVTMPAILSQPSRKNLVLACAVTLVLPGIFAAGGGLRLVTAPGIEENNVDGIRLRIVQANIDQSLKWVGPLRAQHLRTHINMSAQASAPGDPAPSHIIWPEVAVPFALANDDAARLAAAQIIPTGGALITGALRFGGSSVNPYNAVHAIGSGGSILATYDKVHLVPFGEYMPARGILPFDKLVPSQGDSLPGPARATLRIPGLPPFGALVCYEAAFPGAVTAAGDRPDWLLNVTNDAWFGKSAGPHQHFASARMRSIEEGLPLVRAANTGISAVIDPWGRIIGQLALGETGVLDANLPLSIDPTLFARFGDKILIVLLLAALGLAFFLRRRTHSIS